MIPGAMRLLLSTQEKDRVDRTAAREKRSLGTLQAGIRL